MELDFGELEGIDVGDVNQKTKKGVVDIIFVIDISASMGPAIKNLTMNLANFINKLDPNKIQNYRVKAFSFGDLEMDSAETKLNVSRPWTSNPQELVSQLTECVKLVQNGGGGDEPESSLDAVYIASRDGFEEHWSERKRVIVLFTDATPKKIIKETLLGVDADGLQLLSQQINDNHTHLFMFSPEHEDYQFIASNSARYVNYRPIDKAGKTPVEALIEIDYSEVLERLGEEVSEVSVLS
ncbi:MAG: VWA domain-containing protein [Gammaproteobacteria bacterium]|nr:VWA domain-containing protein [Gammaproteobacteria bacterium]